MTINLNFYFYL